MGVNMQVRTFEKLDLFPLRICESVVGAKEIFRLDLCGGLCGNPKSIPSKYMYDEKGSRLFDEITHLPEYYLTRSEIEILESKKSRIAEHLGDEKFNLIEFGSGSGTKTGILIDHFLNSHMDFRYIPIDISSSAMDELSGSMRFNYPELVIEAIISEYFSGLRLLNSHSNEKNLVLFLGSSIGNLSPAQTRLFLRTLWRSLRENDFVLIGFDLKKDIDLLMNAYNDSRGLTSEFNLNVLRRINRELGGDFDPTKYKHFGICNFERGAMESYLISQANQNAYIEALGQTISFQTWEPIHMEYSYKYSESQIETLADQNGFDVVENLYDSDHYFIDSIWRVRKNW
jgi:L-histidine Nalpha-methyltransferase